MPRSGVSPLSKNNYFHDTAIIDPSVTIGFGNYFGPYCVIGPNVKIGNNNRFEAFCSIGLPPEHKDYWFKDYKSVQIGNSGVFREYTTIHSGTTNDTILGNDVVMLRGSHVGHDAFICDAVTISCSALIGGHSIVFQGANLGLNAVIHQYSIIGHYAMLGMSTVVSKKTSIKPFSTYVGNPARFLKNNQIAIEKNGLTKLYLDQANSQYEEAIKDTVRIHISKLLSSGK